MRVAIVGGHGKVARALIPLLAERGDEVVPLVRKQEHADELRGPGVEPRLLDIEGQDADAFAAAFAGAGAVVFAAGAGADGRADRKRTVDLGGALKSIDGAQRAGVQRFVQVSAIGVDEPVPDDTGEVWRAYVEAKRDADAALRASDLAWTIIRPGGLTDGPATGRVLLGTSVPRGEVSRSDVAAVIAAVLAEPASVGKQWELVAGDQPITEAVAAG
ncbi:NAD(P)H-binding protein [Cellulomonas shaoxiangyii]|uniref:NAD-dependent epimerase/dehydratase family protein n=1 Tax=Cellulomonas shaoxiangyii TaxID=2566013 RepID=A0A4P7SDY9_9CELL|nr:NAD(P)H-binding protein [Cellulomonas shaoxiangyii]QCB92309.1 NAD-dependent epimerase/dehydratase family protein [Cellulomonas shaoxiangyii]TGY86296.1 NAD-dependent epimerase/dehydratase family protein [Cellulomonas shaoxiangyii]